MGHLAFLCFIRNRVVFLWDGLAVHEHRHADRLARSVFRRAANHGDEILAQQVIQPDLHRAGILFVPHGYGARAVSHMLGRVFLAFSVCPLDGQCERKVRESALAVGRPVGFKIRYIIIICSAIMPGLNILLGNTGTKLIFIVCFS